MPSPAAFPIIKPLRIFVVEDDPWYGEFLVHSLSLNPDNQVSRFNTATSLLEALSAQPEVITLDYKLPDMRGEVLLAKIRELSPDTAVVIISGQEDVSTAISLIQDGAYDYIVKNDQAKDRLWVVINNIREKSELLSEVRQLRRQFGKQYDLQHLIIGNCEAIKKVYDLVAKAAATNINVSISGETGTGKELVAKAIHFNSNRGSKPFVAVNLASVPIGLAESELFGHEKGAFTGASAIRTGKFEEADGGTLFLDEVADIDISLQVKLLRVLQERAFNRVGGNQLFPVDVRLIVATNKNLVEEVRAGRFREDLFYRIMGLPVVLPPLRDRGNDKLLLARHFAEEFCSANKLSRKILTTGAKEKLLAYHYPGNVRELKAVVELAAVMSETGKIDADDISFTAARTPTDLLDQDLTLEEFDRRIIRHYLNRFDGNVIEAARRLDIGKSTIYKLIKEGKL